MRRDSRPPPGRRAPSGEPDEARLLAGCRAGDPAAFEEFYRSYRRLVAANLFRVMGDRNELDDLMQEVFLIAFRGLERFRGDARVTTWLYRICVNVALGRLRTLRRRPPPVPSAAPAVEEEAEPATSSPERLLERRQDVAQVYRALDRLSPKKRIVLVLHEIEGLDVRQIAEIVRSPAVTVRTRLHYARKEFYRLIAGEEVK